MSEPSSPPPAEPLATAAPSPASAAAASAAEAPATIGGVAAPESSARDAATAGAIRGDGVVHEIQWSDAFAWWHLFRAGAAAFSPTVIVLGALGAVALWAGWALADKLGVPAVDTLPPLATREAPTLLRPLDGASMLEAIVRQLPGPAAAAVSQAITLFAPTSTLAALGGAALRLVWFVVVWSLFGTAIARAVALRLAGEDRIGVGPALGYGARFWTAPSNAALFTLLGMLALAVPAMAIGVLMRADWGLAVAGAIWPLILAGGLVLAILAVGVVVGWPLMVAAVGVERGDGFQAISTAFSYLYQRPLHVCFYTVVALAVAVPALAAAALFADATAGLALWAASFGMGHARTASLLESLATGDAAAAFGARAIRFWSQALETVLGSFGWGYFWAIATAAYMLLRRDVDGTELDEVVVDDIAD
ncbi:MAG: hypothetical protein ACKOCW_08235 [Planctomycetaceae bacterium]